MKKIDQITNEQELKEVQDAESELTRLVFTYDCGHGSHSLVGVDIPSDYGRQLLKAYRLALKQYEKTKRFPIIVHDPKKFSTEPSDWIKNKEKRAEGYELDDFGYWRK